MLPNRNNFCGGNFSDWLEVMLIDSCNGNCEWCIERNGYHPEFHASVNELVSAINESGKKNIILLGGEPLLYRDIKELINKLLISEKNIYITTNGGLLTAELIRENLIGIKGINISIHHYFLETNEEITGIKLDQKTLEYAIAECRKHGINVRFNCNVIEGYICSAGGIFGYTYWAKTTGADNIRFAELKNDKDKFVDLANILDHKYGLNDDPFIDGCNKDTVIAGMPVNFRQMCGLQTPMRKAPANPKGFGEKKVLYYDGKIYDGWQVNKSKETEDMTDNEIRELIKKEIKGTLEEVLEELCGKIESKVTNIKFKSPQTDNDYGSNCRY